MNYKTSVKHPAWDVCAPVFIRIRLDAGIKDLGVQNAYFPCFVSQDGVWATDG